MLLAAQSVQSIDDLFLVRIFDNANDVDVRGNKTIDNVGSEAGNANGGALATCDGATIERMPSDEVSSWTKRAARMLQEQWPRQDRDRKEPPESDEQHAQTSPGNEDDAFYHKLLVHHDKTYPFYSLACSYILLQCSSQNSGKALVLGHGRLTECYESAGGNAVAATYILIDPEHRGKGYGRILVRLLEQEAKSKERLGYQYHFVYLWCKTITAPFYERSGYLPCRNRVSLQRPCLKSLTATSVQSLEDILQRRASSASASTVKDKSTASSTKKKLETVVLLPSSSSSSSRSKSGNRDTSGDGEQSVEDEDVWLRKRLVDHVESIHISEQDRRNEIQYFVVSSSNAKVVSHNISTNTIVVEENDSRYLYRYRWLPRVPWQMQIGPTCGLTAIRMIRDFYYKTNAGQRDEAREGSTPGGSSLLADARKLGYTNDGEMFDANQLRDLMKDQLLVAATTSSFSLEDISIASESLDTIAVTTRETSSLTAEEIDSNLRQGGLWIIPYDSNPRTKQPDKFRGKHAHWGIVVGMLYVRTETARSAITTDTPVLAISTSTAAHASDEMLAFNEEQIKQNGTSIQDNFPNSDFVLPKKENIKSDSGRSLKENANAPIDDVGGFTQNNLGLHLIVQHSLSSKWAIAPIEEWFDSNLQLISVNEYKFELGNKQHLNLSNKIIQILPL